MNEAGDQTAYRCISGHEISSSKLDEESEMVVLDAGAKVRICREHGCPVAISRPPPSRLGEAAE